MHLKKSCAQEGFSLIVAKDCILKEKKNHRLLSVGGGRSLQSLADMLLASAREKPYWWPWCILSSLFLSVSFSTGNSEVFRSLGIQHSGLMLAF